MNSSCSGMKRSLPCVDLNSMALQNDTGGSFPCLDAHWDVKTENLARKKHRLSPVKHKELHNDTRSPFPGLDGYWEVSSGNLGPKKRRLPPLKTQGSPVNPATAALDHFLRMSVHDLIPDFFDLEEDFPIKFHEVTSRSISQPPPKAVQAHSSCQIAF